MNEMSVESHDSVTEVAGLMRLLSDPTRIKVLGLLQPGEMNVTSLCTRLELAQPTVSHHLGLLRNARLVRTRRDGKQIFYSLNPAHLSVPNGDGSLQLEYGSVMMKISSN